MARDRLDRERWLQGVCTVVKLKTARRHFPTPDSATVETDGWRRAQCRSYLTLRSDIDGPTRRSFEFRPDRCHQSRGALWHIDAIESRDDQRIENWLIGLVEWAVEEDAGLVGCGAPVVLRHSGPAMPPQIVPRAINARHAWVSRSAAGLTATSFMLGFARRPPI